MLHLKEIVRPVNLSLCKSSFKPLRAFLCMKTGRESCRTLRPSSSVLDSYKQLSLDCQALSLEKRCMRQSNFEAPAVSSLWGSAHMQTDSDCDATPPNAVPAQQ